MCFSPWLIVESTEQGKRPRTDYSCQDKRERKRKTKCCVALTHKVAWERLRSQLCARKREDSFPGTRSRESDNQGQCYQKKRTGAIEK